MTNLTPAQRLVDAGIPRSTFTKKRTRGRIRAFWEALKWAERKGTLTSFEIKRAIDLYGGLPSRKKANATRARANA